MPQEYPKWSPRGSPTAPEGPKWSPGVSKMEPGRSKMEANGPRWGPARGPMTPQGPQRGSSAAWSSPSRRQDASQGAQGRLVHGFASNLRAPKGAPRGPKSEKKADQNCFQKLLHCRSHFGDKFYQFGVRKTQFFGFENGSKCI